MNPQQTSHHKLLFLTVRVRNDMWGSTGEGGLTCRQIHILAGSRKLHVCSGMCARARARPNKNTSVSGWGLEGLQTDKSPGGVFIPLPAPGVGPRSAALWESVAGCCWGGVPHLLTVLRQSYVRSVRHRPPGRLPPHLPQTKERRGRTPARGAPLLWKRLNRGVGGLYAADADKVRRMSCETTTAAGIRTPIDAENLESLQSELCIFLFIITKSKPG